MQKNYLLKQTILLGAFLCLICTNLNAQVTIGDAKPPKGYSVLELIAQYKGDTVGSMRLPQLTEAEKNALMAQSDWATYKGSLAKGLMIYNMTTDCVQFWDGTVWVNKCEYSAFCEQARVGELVAISGLTGVQWYTQPTGGTALSGTDKIVGTLANPLTSTTYYYSTSTSGGVRTEASIVAPKWWTPCSGAQASNVATITFDANGVGCIADARTGGYPDNASYANYRVRKFGSAGIWMVENLRYIPNNGTGFTGYSFSFANDGTSTANKYYNFPGASSTGMNQASAKAVAFDAHPEYGVLYNWAATLNDVNNPAGTPPGTENIAPGNAGTASSSKQGVCPSGWVVPSDLEWTNLEKEILANPHLYSSKPDDNTTWPAGMETRSTYSSVPLGETMKSIICVNHQLPKGKSNIDGTGFNALMIGQSNQTWPGMYYGDATWFWTNAVNSDGAIYSEAWCRHATRGLSEPPQQGFSRSNEARYAKFSVRCKKSGT